MNYEQLSQSIETNMPTNGVGYIKASNTRQVAYDIASYVDSRLGSYQLQLYQPSTWPIRLDSTTLSLYSDNGVQITNILDARSSTWSTDGDSAIATISAIKNNVSNKIPTDITRAQVDATFVNSNLQPLFYLRQATHSLAGLMTAPDKIILDTINTTTIPTMQSTLANKMNIFGVSAPFSIEGSSSGTIFAMKTDVGNKQIAHVVDSNDSGGFIHYMDDAIPTVGAIQTFMYSNDAIDRMLAEKQRTLVISSPFATQDTSSGTELYLKTTSNTVINAICGSDDTTGALDHGGNQVIPTVDAVLYYLSNVQNTVPTDVTRTQSDATFVNSNHQPLFYLRQATHSLAGLMTAVDKTKLDGMPKIGMSTNILTLNDLRRSTLSASTIQKLNDIRAAEKEIVLIWGGNSYIQFFVEQYRGSFSGYVFDFINGEMLHITAAAAAPPSSDWAVEINKIGGAVEGTLGNLVEIGQDNMGEDSGISAAEVVQSTSIRHIVTLTQSEFDALTTYDPNTEYNVI